MLIRIQRPTIISLWTFTSFRIQILMKFTKATLMSKTTIYTVRLLLTLFNQNLNSSMPMSSWHLMTSLMILWTRSIPQLYNTYIRSTTLMYAILSRIKIFSAHSLHGHPLTLSREPLLLLCDTHGHEYLTHYDNIGNLFFLNEMFRVSMKQ
jgi:hypothetical protein